MLDNFWESFGSLNDHPYVCAHIMRGGRVRQEGRKWVKEEREEPTTFDNNRWPKEWSSQALIGRPVNEVLGTLLH